MKSEPASFLADLSSFRFRFFHFISRLLFALFIFLSSHSAFISRSIASSDETPLCSSWATQRPTAELQQLACRGLVDSGPLLAAAPILLPSLRCLEPQPVLELPCLNSTSSTELQPLFIQVNETVGVGWIGILTLLLGVGVAVRDGHVPPCHRSRYSAGRFLKAATMNTDVTLWVSAAWTTHESEFREGVMDLKNITSSLIGSEFAANSWAGLRLWKVSLDVHEPSRSKRQRKRPTLR